MNEKPHHKRKTLVKKLAIFIFILLLILLILILSFVWLMANDFAKPKRRALQLYHQQIINNAKQEGMIIKRYPCAKGQLPCLIVTQSNVKKPSKRGQIIRKQLTNDFQRKLPPFKHTYQKPKAIIVLLHGRHGRKEDMLPVALRLVASGFVCVIPDLPAHGDSPLKYSKFGTELSAKKPNLIKQTLLDTRQQLSTQNINNVDKLPAFLWGISMGGSYANYTVQNTQKDWQGMIIVASFANLQTVSNNYIKKIIEPLPDFSEDFVQEILAKLFAVAVELQGGVAPEKINPVNIAKNSNVPVLQFHGNRDSLIDIKQGQELYNNYHAEKKFVVIPNANHHNVLSTKYPAYATMADWLLERVDKKK
ncbi:MAG: alpha/beta hydrolase [Moraxellaceae bacterium]|nr:alpha/beta hydrolase [Moraxellaceae bacterium]